ncbi:MAG: hypothetical protein GY842_23375 [bacterium]|nr:hypothetical protein [bacterium]
MRRRLPSLIAWSARLAGWAALLLLLNHVVWNHQGHAVRGQFARLSIPAERDAALADLLQRAGLGERPHLSIPRDAVVHEALGPFQVLSPWARVLHVEENPESGKSTSVFVRFDSRGRLAGAPVEIVHALNSSHTYWSGSYSLPDDFLTLSEIHQPSTAPTSAPAGTAFLHHVYALGFPSSREVLAVKTIQTASSYAYILIERDESGDPVLEVTIQTWTPGSGGIAIMPSTEIIATFTWDDAAGRFVVPERDPQGRWEVVFPTPAPDHQTE